MGNKQHEFVDLGLSVKWSTCNVGASSPENPGDYFAWGEVSPKPDYTAATSITYGKILDDIAGDPQYDAARANWGGSWRLPTKTECEELVNECTWTWTEMSGKNGYKVTGKNGNSIFLPAAGWRYGTSLYYAGENGHYWSSTPIGYGSCRAHSLDFDEGDRCVGWRNRFDGYPVRPVIEEKTNKNHKMTEQDKQLIQMAENVHMREYNMPQILDSLMLKASSQEARNEIAKIRTRKLEELDRYNYHLEEARAGII